MNQWLVKQFGSPRDNENTILKARLPNELLRVIFEHVNSTKDLVILCCVSRLFRLEAERKLYTSLNLLVDFSWLLSHSTGRILHTKDSRDRLLDVKRQIVLFRSINTPRLSEIVTNVEIQLIARYPCKRRVKLLSLNRGFRCSCDKLDSELGDALRGLKNLANLWIDCRLCPRSNKEFRHNFLEELQTRSLGVFRISCLCCYWKCNLKPQSPAFKTVHTLEMTPVLRMPPDISFETECAIFPELKTLCTCSSLFMAMVLAGRPIDTVLVMGWDQSMHEAALGSVYQGSLERLSVLTSVTPSFLAIISQNFRPYRNLHQIGRFVDVIDQALTVFAMLKTLSILPKLSTLVIVDTENADTERTRDYRWDQEFLQEMKVRLPNLTKVRLLFIKKAEAKQTIEFTLWEFDYVWNRRNVSTFDKLLEKDNMVKGMNLA